MSIASILAILAVLWWLVFFCVLPLSARATEARPALSMARIFLRTSLVTISLFLGGVILFNWSGFSFLEWLYKP